MRAESLIRALRGLVLAGLALLACGAVTAEPAHDRAFWLALRAHEFRLPQGESTFPLALEATGLLGSTDPILRDTVAYEALFAWVYTDPSLAAGEVERLLAVLTANAHQGLGRAEGDELFLRSFSTLALSLFAAADLKRPVLSAQQFDTLLELATEQLARERDLRGYVADKGWGHATAHCADLLKFLGRSPRLRVPQQRRIVAAIAGRLRSAGQVFVWGEDARLAAALAALARRADVDPAPFSDWFVGLVAEHAALWKGTFEPARYVAERAQLNALAELAADLDMDPPAPGAQPIRTGLRALREATR